MPFVDEKGNPEVEFFGDNVVPIKPEKQDEPQENTTIQQTTETTQESERSCLKCGRSYNALHASGDPRYCIDCGSDFTVLDEIKKTTIEEYDEFKDILNKFTQKFRQITLQGEFWKFNSRTIKNLSKEQLSAWIEYHRGMVILLEQESTERKVKQVQVQIHTPLTTTRKVTETITKKTTRVKRDPLAGLMDAFKNLTPEQAKQLLATLVGTGGGKKDGE